MKLLFSTIILLVSTIMFGQKTEALFQKTYTNQELSDIELELLSDGAPYIIAKVNGEVFSGKNISFSNFSNETFIIENINIQRQGNAKIYVGKIKNNVFGNSYISEVKGTYWGKIEMNDGSQIMIKPLQSNNQLVLVYQAGISISDEDCHDETALIDNQIPDSETNPSVEEFDTTDVCDSTAVCTGNIVDLLVVYSNSAKLNLGGSTSAAESAIGLAVAEMNTINFNSGNVSQVFTLVAAEEVNYSESGSFSTDLGRLRVGEDGFLDEVHDLRDQYYADVVSMILGSGGCGLGNVNTNNTQYESQSGYSVCSSGCMTGNKTLAHEVGHNLGFRHDRYAYSSTPTIVCSKAWGWVNANAFGGNNDQRWRTVMAYNNECSDSGFNCFRINNWSNPNINFNSDPTGSIEGSMDEADNADILNRAFCQVNDFRIAPDCVDCEVVQECEYYNSLTGLGPGNTTDFQIVSLFPQLSVTGSNAQVCVYYYGDHNNSLEQFNILDEAGNLLGTTVASYDCDIPNRICFDIDPGTYNTWVADGIIDISLDPISVELNPGLCSSNRACVEILIPNTLSNTNFNSDVVDIEIFPNPSSDIIEISSKELIQSITIYNINGRLVKSQAQSKTINISDLDRGVYLLKMKINNTYITKKIIKY